jgi:HEAT repeat protein
MPANRFRLAFILAMLAVTIVPQSWAGSGEQRAWAMFEAAAKSESTAGRETGIRALGLLRGKARARELAEGALDDPKPEVRIAAAAALEEMHAVESIPKLQKVLSDEKISVVMAAAHALRSMKDDASAYAVYFDVLTGGQRPGGLVQQQLDTLRNPKELAMIGLQTGIGYVPFAGIGWDAWRYTHKKNPHPVKAIAASFLAHDPDPATGVALAEAIKDKDWIVRAAAIEALAQRGDPAFEGKIEYSFFDANAHVRYTAAAAVIRLSEIAKSRKQTAKDSAQAKNPQ